ncbi:hypothetical protein [Herbiconiux sp. A18JL235]|uniref:Uncharacterized protein n=1 Tax=Herbiconiux sp. A18JL235 TaxID=3152363 RepID=A0AB39BHD6_9MICO
MTEHHDTDAAHPSDEPHPAADPGPERAGDGQATDASSAAAGSGSEHADDELETIAPTPDSELADELRSIRAVGENRTSER